MKLTFYMYQETMAQKIFRSKMNQHTPQMKQLKHQPIVKSRLYCLRKLHIHLYTHIYIHVNL